MAYLQTQLSHRAFAFWQYTSVPSPLDKDHSITPDFYLPEFNGIKDIYIECFGYRKEDRKYQEIKKYKNQNYTILCEKRKITVVYFSKQEMDKNSFKDKQKWMITPYKVNY